MTRTIATVLTALALVLLSARGSSAQYIEGHGDRFAGPELGLSMSLSPGGLFGMIGGSLLIAPLPWLVLEPGVAQRLREGPRPVGLVRARMVRFREIALSVGLGVEYRKRYESTELGCVFAEYECGRYARNVWGVPVQLMMEMRLRSGFTVAPHIGFKVPVHWDDCRRYGNGGELGSCAPLLRPYFGMTLSWAAPLSVAQRPGAASGARP